MKKVKIMLSAIFVIAIVAGALAFKAKSENVCAYERTLIGGVETTTCNRVQLTKGTFSTTTTTTDDTKYAGTITTTASICPQTAVCPQERIIIDQE